MKGDAHDAKKQQEVNEALTKRINELERQLAEERSTSQSGLAKKLLGRTKAVRRKANRHLALVGDAETTVTACCSVRNDQMTKRKSLIGEKFVR